MECRNALLDASGDIDKAHESLKEKGIIKAAKKAGRETLQGVIEAYIHTGARVGALVELNCETDFVARTSEFKNLARDLAMQVTAMNPLYLYEDDKPKDCEDSSEVVCLLAQAYIKDPSKTVSDLITEMIAKVGENIRLRRFIRFELGN
jgi:elongation factor Ts